jgi:regulator of sirC expression with transglutaminase-like and TPR domain
MDPKAIKNRFRLLLEFSDEALPLDTLCYLLCQLAGYEIDIAAEQAKIDSLAETMAPTFAGVMSSLFGPSGHVRGDSATYYGIDNSLLSRVLARGVGLPITMSVLAMECGKRVRVPIVGVGLPGHFIVRDGNDSSTYADPFNGGTLLDRQGVQRLFTQLSGGNVAWSDAYLRAVNKRDILLRILNNLKLASSRSPVGRPLHATVLELMSWLPSGAPFDPRDAQRVMSPYN